MNVMCPYCDKETKMVSSLDFYGRDYKTNVWVCDCGAYVGTHKNSKTPLGTPANYELRQLRQVCHTLIDPYWKYGKYSRSGVYRRLAKYFNIPMSEAHIGMFDEEKCRKLISLFGKNF